MGFVLAPKTYSLTFEGQPQYDGLKVEMAGLPLRSYLEIQRLQGADSADSSERMVEIFSGFVISWNLEHQVDGKIVPVPVSYASISALDVDFVLTLIGAWMTAIAGVPAPLEQKSTAGDLSLEATMPMAV